jgi:hypothetical protein
MLAVFASFEDKRVQKSAFSKRELEKPYFPFLGLDHQVVKSLHPTVYTCS